MRQSSVYGPIWSHSSDLQRLSVRLVLTDLDLGDDFRGHKCWCCLKSCSREYWRRIEARLKPRTRFQWCEKNAFAFVKSRSIVSSSHGQTVIRAEERRALGTEDRTKRIKLRALVAFILVHVAARSVWILQFDYEQLEDAENKISNNGARVKRYKEKEK